MSYSVISCTVISCSQTIAAVVVTTLGDAYRRLLLLLQYHVSYSVISYSVISCSVISCNAISCSQTIAAVVTVSYSVTQGQSQLVVDVVNVVVYFFSPLFWYTQTMADFDTIYEERDEEENLPELPVPRVPTPIIIRGAGNVTM